MRSIHSSSERGIALIVVLLLMAVLSGLATGFAMTGNIEVQMSTNEVYFAGARAAAEAGLNRAIAEITDNTTKNFLSGDDDAVDPNPTAAVNADNGDLSFLLGGPGPYELGASGQYSYTVQVLDDDDRRLYDAVLTEAEWAARWVDIGEDGEPTTNNNGRVILRATGLGPNGTTVTIARSIEIDTLPGLGSTQTTLSDAAILVNGDFVMDGNITVTGTTATNNQYASVHANGNLTKTGGSGTITGSATATGTATLGTFTPGGEKGGGRPTINVPDIQADNYRTMANFKLTVATVAGKDVPQVSTYNAATDSWLPCATSACTNALSGWSYSGGTWSMGKTPTVNKTYYIDGNVDIGPTSGNKAVSVIATGNINVHGNATLTPGNTDKIQFVSDGDINIAGSVDLSPATQVDGQILVRGQFEASGNMEFQGRVLVQDKAGAGSLIANGASKINGSVKFIYTGSIADISTTVFVPGAPTYTNNVSGWMEQ